MAACRPATPRPSNRSITAPSILPHLRAILPNVEHGARHAPVVVDCANGATTTMAPRLFQELGFEVQCIGCQPDGRNINLRCGSTAPEQLARAVVDGGYPLGIAYDGDGDRAIFVDEKGSVVDGDAVMLMCAKQMKREGRLKGNAIVATVMSNIGLEIALRDAGIDMVRCPVGDKLRDGGDDPPRPRARRRAVRARHLLRVSASPATGSRRRSTCCARSARPAGPLGSRVRADHISHRCWSTCASIAKWI